MHLTNECLKVCCNVEPTLHVGDEKAVDSGNISTEEVLLALQITSYTPSFFPFYDIHIFQP